jgi:hypothetical protein
MVLSLTQLAVTQPYQAMSITSQVLLSTWDMALNGHIRQFQVVLD